MCFVTPTAGYGPIDDGVAFLRGELRRPDDIRSLERDVSRVAGVRGVESLVHTPR